MLSIRLIFLYPDASKLYGKILPWWELREMRLYPKVWFVGPGVAKTPYNESDPVNFGFDKWTDDDREETKLKIVSC